MTSETRNEAGTPRPMFEQWHYEYGFTLDACAVEHNAKLPAYITPEMDALDADWSGERVWCNPPYVDIAPWLAHALEPEIAVYLLPARTDRLWWREWKPQAECHYIVGEKPHVRPQFEAPPGIKYSSNPMSLVLLCFGRGSVPGRERWRSGRTGKLIASRKVPK